MNQQPDKLFREKLAGYSRPAPIGAWEKIDAGLSKKNNPKLGLKIAASVLAVALATYWLWPENNSQKMPIAVVTEKPAVPDTTTEKPDAGKSEQPDVSSADKKQQPDVEKKEHGNTAFKKEFPQPIKKPMNDQLLIAKREQVVVEEVTHTSEPLMSSTLTEARVLNENITDAATGLREQNITLVFSLDEVDDYLDKKSLAKATSDEKKSSTLKKLLKKASDLKNNQDPIGDLRQKKNEILALNFKEAKTKR